MHCFGPSCGKRRDFLVVSAHNAMKNRRKPYVLSTRGTQRREPSLSDTSRQRRFFGRRARIGALSAVTAVAATAGAFGATAASAAPAKPAGGHCSPSVSSQYFGSTVEPYTGKNTAVYRYTLSNCRGMTAQILTYGGHRPVHQRAEPLRPGRGGRHARLQDPGRLREVRQPAGDRERRPVLRRDRSAATATASPRARSTLNQPGVGPVKYTLPINNGVNTLHGGLVGFGNHIWAAKAVHGTGHCGRAAHAGQPERGRERSRRVARLPDRLHRLPGHAQGGRDLHPQQRRPAGHPLQDDGRVDRT